MTEPKTFLPIHTDKDGTQFTVECVACKHKRYEENGWPMNCCQDLAHTCIPLPE